MPTAPAVTQTDLPLPNRRSGKVRDIYDATLPDGAAGLVIVASDRVSAFDVIMANGLPGKGVVLTQISKFWFDRLAASGVHHHLVSTDPADIPGLTDEQRAPLVGRVMIGRKMKILPIECIVRGYLAGSGWKEYQRSQTVCGLPLPEGMQQCGRIDAPIFTPSTKADEGHDENISFDRACEIVGRGVMEKLRDRSIAIYAEAREYAASRGIILADTKFEWGVPLDQPDAEPVLCDEVLTPDSSRFWPADAYQPGRDQNSFDKQIVRNYLQGLCDNGQWDKTPPGPTLPDDIVDKTMRRYRECYELLTGDKAPV
jgi:phosphoribosylaminoimidazole-succinocarboxamide synthase